MSTLPPPLPPCPSPLPRGPRQARRASVKPIASKPDGSHPMAITVVDAPVVENQSRRTREHQFFRGMSVLIALVVFIGFARTYFLAPLFHARPLPALIVHI